MGLSRRAPAAGAQAKARVQKAVVKKQQAVKAKAELPTKRQQAAKTLAEPPRLKRELSRSRSQLLEAQGLVRVNRAPVLTLWMETCLRRLGSPEETALTAAKVIAGRCAMAKGRALGLIGPASSGSSSSAAPLKRPAAAAPPLAVRIAGQAVPLRAVPGGSQLALQSGGATVEPEAVRRYLRGAFGGALEGVRAAMREVADSYDKEELRSSAMSLYERFRPAWRGWGVAGELHLRDIKAASC